MSVDKVVTQWYSYPTYLLMAEFQIVQTRTYYDNIASYSVNQVQFFTNFLSDPIISL